MELDDLKAAWTELDNRLKKNEELKECVIIEMMRSKAGKIVNRFVVWEIIQVVGTLLFIPFCIFWLDWRGGKYLAMDITMFFGLAVCLFSSFWGVYKLHGLMKVDLYKNVGNNIYYVNRYNIQIKREKKIFECFLWPATCVLLALSFASVKATPKFWVLLICALIATTLITYWMYKKFDKSIDSILKSLDEIRELKEE